MKHKKRLNRTLLAASVLAGVVGCSQQKSFEELMQEGIVLAESGDYQAAMVVVRNAVSAQPEHAESRRLLGEVHYQLHNYPEAEKELTRSRELGNTDGDTYVLLLWTLWQQGKFQALIGEAGFLPEGMNDTQTGKALALLSRAYLVTAHLQEAEFALESAQALAPGSREVLLAQADIALSKADVSIARKANATLRDVAPDSADAWRQLGQIEQRSGNFSEAIDAYTRAIELGNSQATDVAYRALVRLWNGDVDTALSDVEPLLKGPLAQSPLLNYIAGVAQLHNDNLQAAQDYLRQAVALQPDFVAAQIYLISTYISLGSLEQARQLSEKLANYLPQHPLSSRILSSVYSREQDYSRATRILEKSLAEHPDNASLLQSLGMTYLLSGKPEEAENYFSQLLELSPEDERTFEMLVISRLLSGETSEADLEKINLNSQEGYRMFLLLGIERLRDLNIKEARSIGERMIEVRSDKPEAFHLVGSTWLLEGDLEKAGEYYARGMAIDKNHLPSVEGVAEVQFRKNNFLEAEETLESYLQDESNYTSAKTWALLSDARLLGGDLPGAEEALIRGLELHKGNTNLLRGLSRLYYQDGDLDRLDELLKTVSDEQANMEPSLWEFKGKVAILKGRPKEAEQAFAAWLEREPEKAEAMYVYGDSLRRLGRFEQAQKQFEEAIAVDPNYLAPRIGLANLLVGRGNLVEAKRVLSDLTERFEANADIAWLEGRVASLEGSFVLAEQRLKDADNELDSPSLTLELARAQWQQSEFERSITTLRNWLERFPNDRLVRSELAALLLGQGDRQGASEEYEILLKQNERDALVLNNLAAIYAESQPKRSLQLAERALHEVPDSPVVKDTLGMILVNGGADTERGLSLLQEASAAAPDDAGIQLNFARALREAGREQEARKQVERVLAMDLSEQLRREANELVE